MRILHLQTRHLVAWEREGLMPVIEEGELYSFEHLSRLRALREMRSRRMSARSIRAQVDAMQRVAGMRNALVETSAVRHGSRLSFRHGGALLMPLVSPTLPIGAYRHALSHASLSSSQWEENNMDGFSEGC